MLKLILKTLMSRKIGKILLVELKLGKFSGRSRRWCYRPKNIQVPKTILKNPWIGPKNPKNIFWSKIIFIFFIFYLKSLSGKKNYFPGKPFLWTFIFIKKSGKILLIELWIGNIFGVENFWCRIFQDAIPGASYKENFN